MKLLLLMAVLTAVLHAQQQQQTVIEATTQEVLLDLVVRDGKGRLIQNLRGEEVTVFDNGAAQSVISFRLVRGSMLNAGRKSTSPLSPAISSIAANAGLLPAAEAAAEPRLVTIVFDQLRPEQRSLARGAALDALRMEGANLYFAVFSIDQKLTMLTPYTRDKERVERAIGRACGQSFSLNTDEMERAQRQQDLAALAENLEALKAARTDPSVPPSTGLRMAQMTLNMLQFADTGDRSQQGRAQFLALWALVREQKRLPGRKTLIYLTGGLSLPPEFSGRFRGLIADANAASVSVYAIDVSGLTSIPSNASGAAMLRQAASSSRTNMTDRSGIVSPDQAQIFDRSELAASSNIQNSLAVLSHDTGGFLAANTNDFRPAIRRIAEEATTHYELTYAPQIERYDGRERSILVRVSRPGATVQTRSGYFALPPSLGVQLQPYESLMLSALSAPEATQSFPFQAAVRWFPSASGDPRTAVIVDVPIAHLTLTRDEARNMFHLHLSVLHLFKDSTGSIVRKVTQDVPGQGELRNYDATRAGHFIHTGHVALPPGEYTLESAVFDRENLTISGLRQRIVIAPQAPALAMSQLTLVRTLTPAAQVDDAVNPFEFPGGRITPELNHSSRPGGRFDVYLVVHGQNDLEIEPSIELWREGRVVATGAEPPRRHPSGDGGLHYIASVTVGESLQPGDYEIRVRLAQTEQRLAVTVQ